MDKFDIYDRWAPAHLFWSPWVKPVLFAHLPLPAIEVPASPPPPAVDWLAQRAGRCAVVLDLKGPDALRIGLALTQTGPFQAIPLFASCPPAYWADLAAVPTAEMLSLLERTLPALERLRPDEAPIPVFLLDALRRTSVFASGASDVIDNRSAVFSTDFPSASLLAQHGIRHCILVRDAAIRAEPDLGYALLPWRKAGITFDAFDLHGASIGFHWPASHFLAALWHRVRLRSQLRANPAGGYGGFVPESAGG